MTETIEKKIMARCPSCNKLAEFTYLGKQKGFSDELELYDCEECKTTLSYKWILFNNTIHRELGEITI